VNLSRQFILRPVATSLLTAAIVLAGIVAYRQLPVAALPQVDYPIIQIVTFYPGASPDVMASGVTAPLERQFGQLPGLKQMTSTSSSGSSIVTLQFDLDKTLDGAATDVQAAISQAQGQLPVDLPTPPTFTKTNPNDQPVYLLGLLSDTLTDGDLYKYASTAVAHGGGWGVKHTGVEGMGPEGGVKVPAGQEGRGGGPESRRARVPGTWREGGRQAAGGAASGAAGRGAERQGPRREAAAGAEAVTAAPPAFYALRDSRTPMLISLASIAVNYATAWTALHGYGSLRRGERVLLHAAAGGVEVFLGQIHLIHPTPRIPADQRIITQHKILVISQLHDFVGAGPVVGPDRLQIVDVAREPKVLDAAALALGRELD